VFERNFVRLYNELFMNQPIDATRHPLDLMNVRRLYPNLYAKWRSYGFIQ
jgi:hypothetical protein